MTDQETVTLTEDELAEVVAAHVTPHLEDWYRKGWAAGWQASLDTHRDTCPPPPTFTQLLEMQRRGVLRG